MHAGVHDKCGFKRPLRENSLHSDLIGALCDVVFHDSTPPPSLNASVTTPAAFRLSGANGSVWLQQSMINAASAPVSHTDGVCVCMGGGHGRVIPGWFDSRAAPVLRRPLQLGP